MTNENVVFVLELVRAKWNSSFFWKKTLFFCQPCFQVIFFLFWFYLLTGQVVTRTEDAPAVKLTVNIDTLLPHARISEISFYPFSMAAHRENLKFTNRGSGVRTPLKVFCFLVSISELTKLISWITSKTASKIFPVNFKGGLTGFSTRLFGPESCGNI